MSSITEVSTSRKRGLSHGVAQVAQPVDQRDAGAAHLLHVEAERDQILPRDAAAARRRRGVDLPDR
jgi:hypothetical protein